MDATPLTGTPITASDTNLIDITRDLFLNQGSFAPLFGQGYTATLRYAGVNGAMTYTQNVAGTTASVTFATGFTQNFAGVDRADLQQQFEDFLRGPGAQEYALLLKLINELSTIAPTDGNPSSTTSMMHRGAFYRYGFLMPATSVGRMDRPELARWGSRPGQEPNAGRWIVGYNPHYTHIRANDGHGHMAGFDLSFGTQLNETMSLVFAGSIHYADIEGSHVWHSVGEVALPLTLIAPTEDQRLLWELTPYAQIAAGASVDLLNGALMPGVGVVSGLHFESGDWLISIANQIGHSDSLEVEVDDAEFDPEISQQLWSNAIRGTTALSESSWFFAGFGYHEYLNNAGVGNWISPEMGFQWADGLKSFSIRYRADLANDYKSHNITVGFGEGF